MELVLATPLVGLLILAVLQFAVWQHAQHVAEAAAGHGLTAARVRGGTAAAGRADAIRVLSAVGRRAVEAPHVSITYSAGRVRVEVSGVAGPVLPGLHLPVRATAVGVVEVIRPGPA